MHSILAVDDSASMRQMVSFTLKNAGFNVVEAVDGQDALEKAGTRDFDLVLTDQNMPRLDGIGLTKRLRDNPKFKTTPILILTTESSDQMKQAGRSAGATGWLVMPGDMPLVTPGSMLAVATALEQYPVAFAQHRGRRGHPVGFSAELYSELVRLTGDDGARRVMARYPAHGVELDDPGVLLDVDTEADLDALRARLEQPKVLPKALPKVQAAD